MGLKTEKKDKLLEQFYEYPQEAFTIRRLSKLTKIPKSTVQQHLTLLKKQDLVGNDNRATHTLLFKTMKITFFMNKIVASGLIDFLIEELNPSLITLFGSIRKGDSIKTSDIDIFVETSIEKELNLSKFERHVKHSIELHIRNDINDLQPHLLTNVLNGIKLYGSIKLQ
ncbi:TPA: ArsR family transcriptional regulator [Candidatus Woesearchaeota archaeon]|nr:hypothetical protein [archaeon]HIJ12074.1 ArsR family transcriptional regulator [Candidatus Woesearchaeota archaeon]|tara:strand:- start:352 stop:858 length:507 start_codon:yes stop_codon:yes gene_type:complete